MRLLIPYWEFQLKAHEHFFEFFSFIYYYLLLFFINIYLSVNGKATKRDSMQNQTKLIHLKQAHLV